MPKITGKHFIIYIFLSFWILFKNSFLSYKIQYTLYSGAGSHSISVVGLRTRSGADSSATTGAGGGVRVLSWFIIVKTLFFKLTDFGPLPKIFNSLASSLGSSSIFLTSHYLK